MSISTIAVEPREVKHLPQAHALSVAVGWPHRRQVVTTARGNAPAPEAGAPRAFALANQALG